MTLLVMCKGLPGSGKSTWALEQVRADPGRTVRVNMDLLRQMLHAGVYKGAQTEHTTQELRDLLLMTLLQRPGVETVITDDTNLSPELEMRFREMADRYGADFLIQDFTDVPIEVCVARDAQRAEKVGREVIYGMDRRYLHPKP